MADSTDTCCSTPWTSRGAVVYMIFNFAEAIVKLFGKVLNWWPLLFVLGLVCIVEAALMYMGYGSILDYIDTSSLGV